MGTSRASPSTLMRQPERRKRGSEGNSGGSEGFSSRRCILDCLVEIGSCSAPCRGAFGDRSADRGDTRSGQGTSSAAPGHRAEGLGGPRPVFPLWVGGCGTQPKRAGRVPLAESPAGTSRPRPDWGWRSVPSAWVGQVRGELSSASSVDREWAQLLPVRSANATDRSWCSGGGRRRGWRRRRPRCGLRPGRRRSPRPRSCRRGRRGRRGQRGRRGGAPRRGRPGSRRPRP